MFMDVNFALDFEKKLLDSIDNPEVCVYVRD